MSFAPLLPWWLILLVALPVLVVLGRAVHHAWTSTPIRRLESGARFGMVLAVTLALLHPGVGRAETSQSATNLDVLIVLDRTTSMSAEDGPGGQSRLDQVRTDLTAAGQALAGSRFALITFGRTSQLEMPFTSDAGALQAAMETVRREEPMDGGGSSMDRPLEQVRALLDRTAQARPERSRILLFLSDGESTESAQAPASFAPLKSLLSGGLVVGYGTAAGGKMRLFSDRDNNDYLYDEQTGEDALSKIDESSLRSIAQQAGVDYLHRTGDGQVASALDSIERGRSSLAGGAPIRHDLTWVWGLLLLLCAAVELRGRLTTMAQTLRAQRALTVQPALPPSIVTGAQSRPQERP